VSESSFKRVAVVAHSYGGLVVAYLANFFPKDFSGEGRVFSVALTDSVPVNRKLAGLSSLALNYASRGEPFGEELEKHGLYKSVSVEDKRHEVRTLKKTCRCHKESKKKN